MILPELHVFLIAGILSLDAMALAAAHGARHPRLPQAASIKIALWFGFFQFAMPVLGWGVEVQLHTVIERIDHWVAFVLLSALGIKMVVESFQPVENKEAQLHKNGLLFLAAVATSIDAFIIGTTLPLFTTHEWGAVSLFGLVTAVLSYGALVVGKTIGSAWGRKSELVGGMILIVFGLHMLVSHVGR